MSSGAAGAAAARRRRYSASASARGAALPIIGFLGRDGGTLGALVDLPLVVASNETARIQEAHIFIGHVLCAQIEQQLGVEARVLSMASVKPLDVDAIVAAARETDAIVTVEEAISTGGLGGAVAETVVAVHPVPMAMLGFPGFCGTGSSDYLIEKAGMSPAGIAAAARGVVARKR